MHQSSHSADSSRGSPASGLPAVTSTRMFLSYCMGEVAVKPEVGFPCPRAHRPRTFRSSMRIRCPSQNSGHRQLALETLPCASSSPCTDEPLRPSPKLDPVASASKQLICRPDPERHPLQLTITRPRHPFEGQGPWAIRSRWYSLTGVARGGGPTRPDRIPRTWPDPARHLRDNGFERTPREAPDAMSLDALRAQAADLDRGDPLAAYRARFHVPRHGDREVAYLCGHSLGLQPRSVEESMARELGAWRDLGVEGHFKPDRPWLSFHELFAAPLARIVGGSAHEVVVMNSLTVNLHLMLASFYRPGPARSGCSSATRRFPRTATPSQHTSPFAAIRRARRAGRRAAGRRGHPPHRGRAGPHRAAPSRTGPRADGRRELLHRRAARHPRHRRGGPAATASSRASTSPTPPATCPCPCTTGASISPSGAATSTSTAGPAPSAGCFVHERHGLDPGLPRLAGWWGHDQATRFQMGPDFVPIPGADGWQLSNPPILALAALLRLAGAVLEVGMSRLRAQERAPHRLPRRRAARALRRLGRGHHARRPGPPRLPVVAARRRAARGRGARGAAGARAWSATGASRT